MERPGACTKSGEHRVFLEFELRHVVLLLAGTLIIVMRSLWMFPIWMVPVNAAVLWCLLVFYRGCSLGMAGFAVFGYISIEWAAYRLRETMRSARELCEGTLELMVEQFRCLFRALLLL